jgi:hypothetical protein
VTAVLRLTDEQRDRIRTIEDEGFQDMLRSFRPALQPANADKDPAPKPRRPQNERILELLTEEQTREWREMTGAPCRGPLRLPTPFDLGSPELESRGPTR